jgi:hypothetical protein
MPKILKKNTAILQVPEKVINDKNKLINSTTNKGDLKKDTIKIQTGKTLKVVSKGTSIEQQKETKPKVKKETKPKPVKETKLTTEPELTTEQEIYNQFGIKFPIIIKPLTEKELKKDFNKKKFGNVDSIEKFNSLNFNDKFNIEQNIQINKDIIYTARYQYIYGNIFEDNPEYYNTEAKRNKGIRQETKKFNDNIKQERKENKSEFLDDIRFNKAFGDFTKYRFIF